MGHYSLDVDPDQLKLAGDGLVELSTDLDTRATQITNTPGEITQAQWSGGARTAITGEMTALGGQTKTFVHRFQAAGEALRTLAETARTAKDVTIPNLNSRWDGANTTYNDAVSKNRTSYDQAVRDLDPEITGSARTASLQSLSNTQTTANGNASAERTRVQRGLNEEYDTLVTDLQRTFTEAGTTLGTNIAVAVPDDVVSTFVQHGGNGTSVGWCNADGTVFPPDLNAEQSFGDLVLLNNRRSTLDGERVASYLDTWNDSDERPPSSIPPEIQRIMNERLKDPIFGQTLANELGPDGVVQIMQKANGLLGTPGVSPEWQYAENPAAERERLVALQDSLAKTLGAAVVGGSSAPGGLKDPKFAEKIIQADPRLAGIMFKYADRVPVAMGADFAHQAAKTLYDMEKDDPLFWRYRYDSWTVGYGSDPDLMKDNDPTLNLLRLADNSAESSQAIMADRTLMKHFLVDQLDHQGRSDAAGDVLRRATIDEAQGTGPEARKAAEISSNALSIVGDGKNKPLEGVKTELAGIVATYMPDVDRAYSSGDLGPDGKFAPGVFDHGARGWPEGVLPEDGWPRYGIMIDKNQLANVLGDLGGDDAGAQAIARSATAYNHMRLERGAIETGEWAQSAKPGEESPLTSAARNSTQLQGFLVDHVGMGDIKEEQDQAAQRQKIAKLFLLPTEFVPVGKIAGPAAPIANLVIGEAKDAATKAFVGDGVQVATTNANSDWETSREVLKAQVLDAARVGDLLSPEEEARWRQLAGGDLTPVSQLEPGVRQQLLQELGESGTYASTAKGAVEGGYDNYTRHFR